MVERTLGEDGCAGAAEFDCGFRIIPAISDTGQAAPWREHGPRPPYDFALMFKAVILTAGHLRLDEWTGFLIGSTVVHARPDHWPFRLTIVLPDRPSNGIKS